MSNPLPSPILPRDVAVIDDDLLWRAEVMNACSPLYSDDFVVVGEALDHIEPGTPCVMVIGPNSAESALAHIPAAREGRPYLRILIVDPENDDGQLLSGRVYEADAVVPSRGGTQQIVAEVNRLLEATRTEAHREIRADGIDRETKLVVVTGAKAGEGATVTAVHLALALQNRGVGQVTLADTDPTFGDVAMRLGLEPQHHDRTSTPRPVSPTSIRELVTDGPDGLQVFVLPHAHHELHALPASTVPTILETLQPGADVIVLDASFDLVQQAGLRDLADRLLLVTTPGLSNLKNADIAGTLLDRGSHVGAIVNRLGGDHRRFRHADQPEPRDIQHAIGLPVIGVLPETNDVATLPDRRSDKDFADAIDRVADRVLDPGPFA